MYHTITMKLGAKLKERRLARGLLQKDVAKEIGISREFYVKIELGKQEPRHATLVALADFFEVSTDYLLGREDEFGNPIK